MPFEFTFTIPTTEYNRLYDLVVHSARTSGGNQGYSGWEDNENKIAYVKAVGTDTMLRTLAVDLEVEQSQIDNLENMLAA